ncbi:MAG: VWA domain-containing protein [candidate division Zixibacteria bacterium]|nr:VWA domain-containing protein [candidate division Zixibacteria bacterium]MDH3937881.1 VWA domain-containing protein [candidate division Zixibacteria bacterium]MDH4034613.1 VWA domain-containing protein [candidate division Zixibacteria bacterium]
MRFADPINFAILPIILLLGVFVFFALARKKKLMQRFGDLPLLMKNAPYISFTRQRTKSVLILLALMLVAVALARLQFGTHLELLKREGIDIVIALDVSNSMMARDMAPNRLDKAKQEIRGIIERLKGDRIGLVVFAGEAFIQCPLTLDYSAAGFLLEAVDNASVSVQGTSLTSAIEMSSRAFAQQEKQHKVLLLLTDGEDHEGGAEEKAEEARQEGIKIYTVGIGNPDGEPIPILDRAGKQMGFKKDENGEVIVSSLDETTLQKVSLATGGKYYHATAGEIELDRIFDEISSMEKKELEGALVTRYDDRFQWPLLLAIFLVIGEFFLSERKKRTEASGHA